MKDLIGKEHEKVSNLRKTFDKEKNKWETIHNNQINEQIRKIMGYQLIDRYITIGELKQLVSGYMMAQIEPKRWILLIVDEVYKKVKTRYRAQYI